MTNLQFSATYVIVAPAKRPATMMDSCHIVYASFAERPGVKTCLSSTHHDLAVMIASVVR